MKKLFPRPSLWLLLLAVCVVALRGARALNGPAALSPAMIAESGGELDPFAQDISSLPPRDAAVFWSGWGDYYSHAADSADKMFLCFTKALEADGKEPVHHENLANVIFMFRKDAMRYYGRNEQQVFDLALAHYDQALRLERNFERAKELARCYYLIKPTRAEDALKAWNVTLSLARTEAQRQEVYLDLARLHLNAGRVWEAKKFIERVTYPGLRDMRETLEYRVAVEGVKVASHARETEMVWNRN
ncbi:MAG: hypothetical protein AB1705_19130 [Verrucomicrobiota bacterium]